MHTRELVRRMDSFGHTNVDVLDGTVIQKSLQIASKSDAFLLILTKFELQQIEFASV